MHRMHGSFLWVGWVVSASSMHWASLRLYPGGWWASATYHSLHLFSELLVQQSIYKRVDRRVEQDYRVRNDNRGFTNVAGCDGHHNVNNWVCAPTDCKDGTDSYDYQGDSFPHPNDTLVIMKIESRVLNFRIRQLAENKLCQESGKSSMKTLKHNNFSYNG